MPAEERKGDSGYVGRASTSPGSAEMATAPPYSSLPSLDRDPTGQPRAPPGSALISVTVPFLSPPFYPPTHSRVSSQHSEGQLQGPAGTRCAPVGVLPRSERTHWKGGLGTKMSRKGNLLLSRNRDGGDREACASVLTDHTPIPRVAPQTCGAVGRGGLLWAEGAHSDPVGHRSILGGQARA